jgi:hypothetical protein
MAVDLSKQLRELQKASDDLNDITDRANDIVGRVEAFLGEQCRVGGEASVPVAFDDADGASEEGPEWETYLQYGRFKGKFRFLVTHTINGDPHETKPWTECSRDIKLKTVEALPELIGKLLETVKSQIGDARAKIDLLEAMLPPGADSQQRSTPSKKG